MAGDSDVFGKTEYMNVYRDMLYNNYMNSNDIAKYDQFLKNKAVSIEGVPDFRFDYKIIGKATKDKYYPVYISLHGGGRTTKEKNDRQWNNQKGLYDIPFGIYVAPRAPWDDWDMWFKQPMDRLIEELVKTFYFSDHDIDVDRIYLLGYSAGADGVWRLATRMPDIFAAASAMAGHPGDVSLVNLFNLPFMIWVGENDSAYNRNKECASRIHELARLRAQNHGNGYVFSGHVLKGKGHWMDNEDAAAISWMSRFERDPHPEHVVWRQGEIPRNHMYQLEVDIEEAQRGKEAVVDFDYGRNSITIRKSDYDALYININDEMFDMDKNIRVFDPSGKLIFDGIVQRKKSRLLHSFHVYGGIFAGYPGRIDIHDKGRSAGDAFIEIEGGPIWGNDHARKRCPEVLAEWLKVNPGMQAEWNGEWSTTIQGKMSVCRIKTQKFLRQGDRIYP